VREGYFGPTASLDRSGAYEQNASPFISTIKTDMAHWDKAYKENENMAHTERSLKLRQLEDEWKTIPKEQVEEWSIEGEQVVADINKVGNDKYGFWVREVGLVDATEIVARALKKADPSAKLIITEDHLMDERFANEQPTLRRHFFAFLDELQKRNVPLDGVGIENNAWIHNPPSMEFMQQILNEIKKRGLYIANSETGVLMTEEYPWYERVKKTREVAPEIIHRDIAEAYIQAGAKGIGFGNAEDKWSFWQYSNIDGQDSLFDKNGQPKPAFYEVLKVIYKYAIVQ